MSEAYKKAQAKYRAVVENEKKKARIERIKKEQLRRLNKGKDK